LKITIDSLDTRELLISLRRIIYGFHDMEREVGNSWLAYAKLARKNKNYSQAASAMLQAREYQSKLSQYYFYRAKLAYAQGEINQALGIVENPSHLKEIENILQNESKEGTVANSNGRLLAKMMLSAANWEESLRKKKTDELRESYQKIIKKESNWEEGYFYLAKYLDSLFLNRIDNISLTNTDNEVKKGPKIAEIKAYQNCISEIIANYGNSLVYGVKHLYYALPRMLTLLCDAGDFIFSKDNGMKLDSKLSDIMNNLIKAIHPSIWMVALSQMLSRISHDQKDVRDIIHTIIKKSLTVYPKQVMWKFCALLFSSNEATKKLAAQIIKACIEEADPSIKKILGNYNSFIYSLLLFCKVEAKGASYWNFSKRKELESIRNLLPDSEVMVPVQSALSPELIVGPCPEHTPLHQKTIDFQGYEENIVIMRSQTYPKKMTFIGSDGMEYRFLAKPRDDIRKDNRFMEFSRMLNRLFLKDPNTRRRKLYIRTYSAIPLSEEGGILEWVDNAVLYAEAVANTERLEEGSERYYSSNKSILCEMLRCAKPTLPNPKLKNSSGDIFEIQRKYYRMQLKNGLIGGIELFKPPLLNRVNNSQILNLLRDNTDIYRDIIQIVPCVLANWFNINFPEPTKWFRSRLNYIRTCAVMSMVGWVMGLGDRHTENILLDQETGELIHIDLNMLFEKGLDLLVQERVPFRLTRNMVDAMGVTGYEGAFRTTCEVSLQLLRDNRETLMSIINTFAYDARKQQPLYQKISPLEIIDRKLRGFEVIKRENLSNSNSQNRFELNGDIVLSVQGQVDQLISYATDDLYLSNMWPYWGPFI
jgi:serine/threonine-protein kinase ATR